MKKNSVFIVLLLITKISFSQDVPSFKLTNTWLATIDKLAASTTKIPVTKKKKILIFSLHTGYEHWTIPHTESVIKLIAEKSNAFNVETSKNINSFKKKSLKNYDAIILNNNCPTRDKRNIFWDVIHKDTLLNTTQKEKKIAKLEKNLINYVKKGGGLIVLHGGITILNKSEAFSEVIGGSFNYHPKQQKVAVKLVNPQHPMVSSFNTNGFEHIDEPYFFKNAYFKYNFRPLLYMNANEIKDVKHTVTKNMIYLAWIKSYKKGKIFYCSLSHNPQSFENAGLLKFILNGMQYATGDFKCDDTPINK